ncbi:hypothetical protein AB0O34_20410 [Sphaerisporangium sp. NPDC088356]
MPFWVNPMIVLFVVAFCVGVLACLAGVVVRRRNRPAPDSAAKTAGRA